MLTRNQVLAEASEKCLQAIYEHVLPQVTWEEFVKENKEWKEGTPRPYEFYYLPQEVLKDIVEEYQHAYRIGSEFAGNLDLLEDYFKRPTRDKYIEGTNEKPGYRSYEHFAALPDVIGQDHYDKVAEYIEEAKKYYNRDWELNSFNMTVYLGPSPNSNKQAVIDNWKKYRGKDIEIDDSYWNEDEDEY